MLNFPLAQVLFHALLVARSRIGGVPLRRDLPIGQGYMRQVVAVGEIFLTYNCSQSFAILT